MAIEDLIKGNNEFLNSFTSKIAKVEKKVEEAFKTITDFISEKESERDKEFKELKKNHKEISAKIKTLNSEATQFNNQFVQKELEEHTNRSLLFMEAQIREVVINTQEKQLRGNLFVLHGLLFTFTSL